MWQTGICWTRGGNPQQVLAVQISERCPDFHFISNANLNRSYRNTCSHFHFFQNANLAVQIFGKVFTFSFLMKIKMWTPFLSKSVQKRCSHFDFHQKRKCEHLSKNLDGQICDLKKLKMWTPFQKSGRPDLRFEWKWKSGHLSKIWTARNCWEFPPLKYIILPLQDWTAIRDVW